MNSRFPWLTPILWIISGWLILDIVAYFFVEASWFQEMGYFSVLWKRFITEGMLWLVALGVSGGYCLGNLYLAQQFKYEDDQKIPIPEVPALGLRRLLVFVFGLLALLNLTLIHYGTVARQYWHPDSQQPQVAPLLPQPLNPGTLWQLLQTLPAHGEWMIIAVGISFAVIIRPQLSLNLLAILFSLGLGLILASHWGNILLYFSPSSFSQADPLFNRPLDDYIFALPVWQLITFGLMGVGLYAFLATTLVYLLSGNSLSQGRFPRFTKAQQQHLHALGSFLMAVIAAGYWIARYELLYSTRGVNYGASYTDVTTQLPAYTFLSLMALLIAVFLGWQAIFSVKDFNPDVNPLHRIWVKLLPLPFNSSQSSSSVRLFADSYSLRSIWGSYLVIAVIIGWLLPEIVQSLIVEPNELQREKPFIERTIHFTKQAFDLKNVEIKTFELEGRLTYQDIQHNDLTIRNIRLWDTRPLLQTNRQLQQIRPYYEFFDADIDRYTLLKENFTDLTNRTEKQQVIISGRELNYQSVPDDAQTWVNQHLVYTHGYGFTLSPVNTVAAGGLPEYFVKNIGAFGNDQNPTSALEISSERIRQSIPIGQPRIYYGELTNTDVMIDTKVKELDYPSGDENIYNIYDGRGGIQIGNLGRRALFAQYLQNWQMIFTRNFTSETRLLFRRNINQRVQAIAPFLRYDKDPYLVVADAEFDPENSSSELETRHYLYWIIDAYTTSDHYPYADRGKNQFNYIRNSVKVVIDAYNGSVYFYVVNLADPIIASWQKIFPELFRSIETMPRSLKAHIRYPLDLFRVQSERLSLYHMEDAQVFYNREDVWRIPLEIYASEQKQVEPYYLIMKLPEEQTEEFILLLPFTPVSRNNLIAWFAARSDSEHYGKLLLYQFPKQRLIFGPEQVEALINQVPQISQQISLWDRQGSQAVQGNLLVIPIEQSLLYVEPIYLEATENSLPTLVRVIVSYENRIVMKPTLEEALKAVFEVEPTLEPIIIPNLEGG